MTRDGIAAKSRRSRAKRFITPDEFLAQLHEADSRVRVRRLDWRATTWRTAFGEMAIGRVEFQIYNPYLDKEEVRQMDPRLLPTYVKTVKSNREAQLRFRKLAEVSA